MLNAQGQIVAVMSLVDGATDGECLGGAYHYRTDTQEAKQFLARFGVSLSGSGRDDHDWHPGRHKHGRGPEQRLALVGDGATPGLRGVALLVCAVARAHERAGEDGAEAERLALLAQPAELVGVHPAVDRRVLRATAAGTGRS